MAVPMRKVRAKWYLVAAGVVFIGILLYSTLQQNKFRYEVCVDFNGRSHCASAAGPKPADAIRSAQEIDCQLLANGRDENMACLGVPPSSVREIKEK